MRQIITLMLVGSFFIGCGNRTKPSTSTVNQKMSIKSTSLEDESTYPNSALIKTSLDDQDRKIMNRTSPRTLERMDRGEPLTIGDIIKLSQGGVGDDIIVQYMKETRTTYNLSQSQINRLQESGVSQRVINYMIETGK